MTISFWRALAIAGLIVMSGSASIYAAEDAGGPDATLVPLNRKTLEQMREKKQKAAEAQKAKEDEKHREEAKKAKAEKVERRTGKKSKSWQVQNR